MNDGRQWRDEAAICRQLAREITDPKSVAMFLERAAQLEARADALGTPAGPAQPTLELTDSSARFGRGKRCRSVRKVRVLGEC